MFCPECGTKNDESASVCSRCGTSFQTVSPPIFETATPSQHVPSYFAQAIIVTILCCLPLGIVAIVYAAQVSGKLLAGDIAGAQNASKMAKTWCWVAFGSGIVLFFAAFAFGLFASFFSY